MCDGDYDKMEKIKEKLRKGLQHKKLCSKIITFKKSEENLNNKKS